jgi:hypothetical protein
MRLGKAEKKFPRWIFIACAIIGLLVGINQGIKYYLKWQEENEKASALVAAARMLNDSGDYESAWETLEKAFAIRPSSEEVQTERANTAMLWLRNIHLGILQGENKISGITDKLLPALRERVASTQSREKADVLAHIGWANYLKFRDGYKNVKVEENLREALQADSVNVFANAMLGFWLLYPGGGSGTIAEAKKHFELAKKDGREGKFLRKLTLWAYRNGNPELQYEPEIITMVNDMRTHGDTIPFIERMQIVNDVYYSDDALLESIFARLTPQEHLQTFFYLVRGIDLEGRLYLQFIHAMILEKMEDYRGAAQVYRAIASKKSYEFRYKSGVTDGVKRLSDY